MTLRDIISNTQKFAKANSPTILTSLGVVGTLTTAYLTGRASFQAAEILRRDLFERNANSEPEQTNRDKVELLWKLYIPAVATGVGTVGCIVMANRVQGHRVAALAAAYSLSERAFTEYKEKVVEKIGENKERAVRDEIAQDRVRNNPPQESQVIVAGSGEVLCHDAFSGRYFKSDMETLKKAQNDINYKVLHEDSAPLTDFYNMIGLPPTSVSDDLGWNNTKLLELLFTSVMSEDDKPCLSFDFATVPFPDFWRYV